MRKGGVAAGVALLMLCGSLLCGCDSVTVRQDLTQEQAQEIIAALASHGIGAASSRERGARGRYSVQVRSAHYSDAISLMQQRGLPSEARPTFQELIGQRGLVPESREIEALRIDRALAAEIEEALQNNPALLSARVVVRLNSAAFVSPESQPTASVSATLVERPGAKVNQDEVRQVISGAMPGISPERIFLAVHPAPSEHVQLVAEGVERTPEKLRVLVPLVPFLWMWRVPYGEYASLAVTFGGIIIMVFCAGGLFGYVYGFYQRGKGASLRPLTRELPRKPGLVGRQEDSNPHLPES